MTLAELPDGPALGHLREGLSSKVFGAEYRAEVGLAIAGIDRICKKDLKDAFREAFRESTGSPPGDTSITNEFDLLIKLGLLARVDAGEASRKKYFVPLEESAYWTLCRELRDRATARTGQSASS
jgi:hypothetical protein